MLLHRMQEKDAAELVRRLGHEPQLRDSEGRELLRQAMREVIGEDTYLRQAKAALTRLEQFSESFTAIARFRQAMEILRFLHTSFPPDLLYRALVVRTVGGENLSFVRMALASEYDASLEHVCLARKEAVETVLQDSATACDTLCGLLSHPSPAVQLTAMYGLERLGDTRALGPLLRIAEDLDSPVCDDARRLALLLNYGTPDVFTLLRPALHNLPPETELLRSVSHRAEDAPESLLRPLASRLD